MKEESERRNLEVELETVKKCQEEKKKRFNPVGGVKQEKSQLDLELEALRLQQMEKKASFKPQFDKMMKGKIGSSNEEEAVREKELDQIRKDRMMVSF